MQEQYTVSKTNNNLKLPKCSHLLYTQKYEVYISLMHVMRLEKLFKIRNFCQSCTSINVTDKPNPSKYCLIQDHPI